MPSYKENEQSVTFTSFFPFFFNFLTYKIFVHFGRIPAFLGKHTCIQLSLFGPKPFLGQGSKLTMGLCLDKVKGHMEFQEKKNITSGKKKNVLTDN